MDYFISLIAEQTRDLMGEEYPFIRFYAADDQNLFSAHNSSGSAEWTHSQDIRLQF